MRATNEQTQQLSIFITYILVTYIKPTIFLQVMRSLLMPYSITSHSTFKFASVIKITPIGVTVITLLSYPRPSNFSSSAMTALIQSCTVQMLFPVINVRPIVFLRAIVLQTPICFALRAVSLYQTFRTNLSVTTFLTCVYTWYYSNSSRQQAN